MSNEIKKAYSNYEKKAGATIKNQSIQAYIMSGTLGALFGIMVGTGHSAAFFVVSVGVGTVLGVLAGVVMIRLIIMRSNKMFSKLNELTKSEGYSDAAIAEAYRLLEKLQKTVNERNLTVNLAMMHNIRGEFSQALNVLQNMDETSFIADPSLAELYYAQKMLAMLGIGDLDRSADTYNRGIYYMKTYMHHSVYGGIICNALAVYEFYCGHYDMALQLISDSDNAFNKLSDNKAPSLCEWAVNRYWQALILSMRGNKTDALEALNSIGNEVHITDYYKAKIAKLREELRENETLS